MYLSSSPFTEGNSFIHRRDPRVKILIALLFSLLFATTGYFLVLNLGVIIALIMIWFARLPRRPLLQRLLTLNLFNILIFLVLPFSISGAGWQFGSLQISQTGLWQAIEITVKTNTILLWLTVLLSTVETVILAHALRDFHVPDKLILLLLFTLRYIEVLHQEYVRLRQAMLIRAFRPQMNCHTYRSIAYLVGMLLIKSFDRSERMMAAMKCRGFHGKFLLLHDFHLNYADLSFGALMLGGGLGLIGIAWFLP